MLAGIARLTALGLCRSFLPRGFQRQNSFIFTLSYPRRNLHLSKWRAASENAIKTLGYDINIRHNPPQGFFIREATFVDIEEITDLWFKSFNDRRYISSKFFDVAMPESQATRDFLRDLLSMSIRVGPSKLVTHVVEDLSNDGKIVACGQFSPPQPDGPVDLPFPQFPKEWDPEIADALWGKKSDSRALLLGKQPHWWGIFVLVDTEYQRKGLAFPLMDWACHQADATGTPMYGIGTPMGYPYWKKHFGFRERKMLDFPVRPETYGVYYMVSIVRPPRVAGTSSIVQV
ncbi:hypothetical protein AOL_s00043g783 [Orbilia oligospora ATCC 24927]|uniref:N-acetyltransferase domain-containing protein n=1 Tax=Arthrobotrys oligospora (strain ATCC 24927 / CBS 115.81 / DSM 1491) TaxID=756982 RepID=G1X509_ARTOA|nr:hypothetical protein AOL_s00043g783 [Orbilia oligospora ATCC 24927]EGX51764.1 hypothetical protein AOL_s00043g783 [Orbilia oligospora ATCC 24927]